MRELKRSVARTLIETQGISQINKKKHLKGRKKVSFFSLHWREYLAMSLSPKGRKA